MPPEVVLLATIGATASVFGIYTITHRAFPTWFGGALLWPLVRVTPSVALAAGCAAIVVGITALGFPFVFFAPVGLAAPLTALGIGGASSSLMLVAFATWLSRRPETGRR